jgi:hypothetical protein
MDDEEYARRLFEILTRPLDPDEPVDAYGTGSDRIDRYDGFGTEVTVTSIDVVPGPHGSQLDVGYHVIVPEHIADVPPDASVLLPFDAAWRADQGFTSPKLHAPFVASDVMRDVGRHVGAHHAPPAPAPVLPDRDAQWAMLLEVMGSEGTAAEVAPGRIDVRRPDGRLDVTVVVTPDQWEQVVAKHGIRREWLLEHFSELLASGHRDEQFLVFWKGDLVRSLREELPPVNGSVRSILELQAARDRGEEPYPDAYWSVGPPRRD